MQTPYFAVAKMIWRETSGRVIWVMLVALIAGLTEGISVSMLIPIVASASPEAAAQASQIPVVGRFLTGSSLALPWLLAIFVALIIIQSALNFVKNYYSLRLMQLVSDRLKRRLFYVLSSAKWDAIARRQLADVNNILTAGIPRCMTAAGALIGLCQAGIIIAIFIGLAAAISWPMALFSSIVGATLFITMYPIRRLATRYGHDLTHLFERQSRVTLEFLNGVRLAKSLLAEPAFRRSYDRHLALIRRGTLKYFALSSAGSFYFQVSVAIIAACFVYLSLEIVGMGLGEIAVLLVIFARLTPRFGAIQEQGQQFLSNASAYTQYDDMVAYFERETERRPDADDVAPTLRTAIVLRGIAMQHHPKGPRSVDGIDTRIEAGRVTALVGQSGSGKSTLADIIAGLTTPTHGSVFIDDTLITDANRRLWRSRVATVPQDPFLFNASIRDNLRLAKPGASDEEIWGALERAQMAHVIRSLPAGLGTRVGSRGARFSGGERQRIVIARALLPEPEILILDEATSALDQANQNLFAAMLDNLRLQGLTVLLIAHQPALVEAADAVIQLAGGKLEDGSSEERDG